MARLSVLRPAPPAFEIEAGRPVPETRGRARKYPFDRMAVGDSFFAPEPGPYGMRSAAHWYRTHRCPDFRVTIRKEGHGFRLWRVG
jgi:hypothetical protein